MTETPYPLTVSNGPPCACHPLVMEVVAVSPYSVTVRRPAVAASEVTCSTPDGSTVHDVVWCDE